MKKIVGRLTSVSIATSCLFMGFEGTALAEPQPIQHGSINAAFSDDDDSLRIRIPPTSNDPGINKIVFGDEYTLTAREDERFTITITSGSNNLNPAIFVQTPDGRRIRVDINGTVESFTDTVSIAGTYRFVVYPSNNEVGQYTLNLNHRDRAGDVIDPGTVQADRILQQFELAGAACAPGVIQININGISRCAVPTPSYPLNRSPYRYDSTTNQLIGITVPDPDPISEMQEFLQRNPGIREVPCGVRGVAEIQFSDGTSLCTRDVDEGIYTWSQPNRLVLVSTLEPDDPPEESFSFSCDERFDGFALVVENSEGQQGTMVSFLTDNSASSYTPADRCNIVVGRLQNLARSQGSSLENVRLAVGQSNNAQIVCALTSTQSNCGSTNQLYQVTPQTRGIHEELPVSGRAIQEVFSQILRY